MAFFNELDREIVNDLSRYFLCGFIRIPHFHENLIRCFIFVLGPCGVCRPELRGLGQLIFIEQFDTVFILKVLAENITNRRLKRAVQNELQNPLASKLLAGEFADGDTIHVTLGDDRLEFERIAAPETVDKAG